MYIKGYDNSGADKHTVFTHTPLMGQFTTFTGSSEIDCADFVEGNLYITVWNTKKQLNAWAYQVFYSRNLKVTISFAPQQ